MACYEHGAPTGWTSVSRSSSRHVVDNWFGVDCRYGGPERCGTIHELYSHCNDDWHVSDARAEKHGSHKEAN